MSKRPVRVYKKTKGRMVPVDAATAAKNRADATPAQPVYAETADSDRAKITHRAVEHSEIGPTRMEQGPSKYDGLLHSIYDAVLITDMDGNITEANARAERAFMLARDDLYGRNLFELVSGADEKLLDVIRENADNRRFTVLEAVCLRADGTRFFAEIVINRLRGRQQKSLCIFARDVTERRRAEENLKHANERLVDAEKIQARLDTVSTLIHAINNPLQILMCMAELDQNREHKKQVDRIVEVIVQLRRQESLDTVPDEESGARYDIPAPKELLACDMGRILVVDDEQMLRDIFLKSLSAAFPGLVIETASDGQEARDIFEKNRPGIIIMDLSMPVMNGEESYRQINSLCGTNGWLLPAFIFFARGSSRATRSGRLSATAAITPA
ncbi:MAG: PAS domain S-box protein [Verrucomicrobiota bacterium]|nr:PAS domain S-box protein [Verrucomicrobiota bacterium]